MTEQDRSRIAGMTNPTPDGTVDEEDRAQLAEVDIADQGEEAGAGVSSWKKPESGVIKFPFF